MKAAKFIFIKTTIAASLIFLSACAGAPPAVLAVPAPVFPASVEEAVASPLRTAENKKRDEFRHPVETLNFFGVQPNMTVIEISPSGGWYGEILAPLLATRGHYIAGVKAIGKTEGHHEDAFQTWLDAHAAVKEKVAYATFNPGHAIDLGAPNSADLVLTFRNVHNWMGSSSEKDAFKAFFTVLKSGGVLGVVEHRAKTNRLQDPKARSGYVRPDYIIKIAKAAGFKTVTQSEVNANPKDTKDYAEGVWTLPPNYALDEKDHAKYEAIGESDRATLRFVKP